MEYKKIKKDNYTLHLINTDRFKMIDLNIVFTKKYDKKDSKFYSLLTRNLTYSTKKYNTKSKMVNKCEQLYSMHISSNYETIGALERLNVYSNFINPKYVDYTYEEIIDFLFEIINNPNITNNKFNKNYFDLAKNDIITLIKSQKDNPNIYSSLGFNKLMYKKTPKENNVLPSIEELDKVNEENLYKFYKQLFTDKYKLDVFLYGDIDENKAEYLENKLKNYTCNNNLKLDINPIINRDNKVIKNIDTLSFNQSKLYLGYDISNLNDYEIKYVIKVYNTILGTMNDSLLFNIVREENSLCYSVSSYYSTYYKSLVVYAGINKDNYEKAVSLIKECINKMSDIKIIEKLINPSKKTINTFLNTYYDDSFAQIEDKYISEFEEKEDIETLRNKLSNVTVQDIINLSKKLRLSVIYMMKGDN